MAYFAMSHTDMDLMSPQMSPLWLLFASNRGAGIDIANAQPIEKLLMIV